VVPPRELAEPSALQRTAHNTPQLESIARSRSCSTHWTGCSALCTQIATPHVPIASSRPAFPSRAAGRGVKDPHRSDGAETASRDEPLTRPRPPCDILGVLSEAATRVRR